MQLAMRCSTVRGAKGGKKDLESKLAAIHDSSHKGVGGCGQILLGSLPGTQQLLQNLRQDTLAARCPHKAVTRWSPCHLISGHLMQPAYIFTNQIACFALGA